MSHRANEETKGTTFQKTTMIVHHRMYLQCCIWITISLKPKSFSSSPRSPKSHKTIIIVNHGTSDDAFKSFSAYVIASNQNNQDQDHQSLKRGREKDKWRTPSSPGGVTLSIFHARSKQPFSQHNLVKQWRSMGKLQRI